MLGKWYFLETETKAPGQISNTFKVLHQYNTLPRKLLSLLLAQNRHGVLEQDWMVASALDTYVHMARCWSGLFVNVAVHIAEDVQSGHR